MKQFLTQFNKEFRANFNGFSAYIIIAAYYILSLFSALYLGDYFLRESEIMNAYFIMQPVILTLVIPATTMRTWAAVNNAPQSKSPAYPDKVKPVSRIENLSETKNKNNDIAAIRKKKAYAAKNLASTSLK